MDHLGGAASQGFSSSYGTTNNNNNTRRSLFKNYPVGTESQNDLEEYQQRAPVKTMSAPSLTAGRPRVSKEQIERDMLLDFVATVLSYYLDTHEIRQQQQMMGADKTKNIKSGVEVSRRLSGEMPAVNVHAPGLPSSAQPPVQEKGFRHKLLSLASSLNPSKPKPAPRNLRQTTIEFRRMVQNIFEDSRVAAPCMVVGLMYFDRFINSPGRSESVYDEKMSLLTCFSRYYSACVGLASKMNEDRYLKNCEWLNLISRRAVPFMSMEEFNARERMVLTGCRWNLMLSDGQMKQYIANCHTVCGSHMMQTTRTTTQ